MSREINKGTCKKHDNNLQIGLDYLSPGQETLFLSHEPQLLQVVGLGIYVRA